MPPVPQFLIIDDDPLAIESLYAALRDFGEFRFATSGRAGLALLLENPADLVLLDANMPDLDGYATCEALKLNYPDTPVIFVTAASDPDSEIRALTVGAVDLIAKPLNPPLVRARVKTHLQLKQHSDLLRALLKRDPLTGIANRLSLDEQVAIEWRRALRTQSPLSVLMIDIDFFKAYNDCYGHPEGDECLRQVAQTIAAEVKRGSELAARYGGEEFAVLLPACTGQQALELANLIGASVQALAIPHAGSTVSDRITVSIGVAGGIPLLAAATTATPAGSAMPALDALKSIGELFSRADAALYAAKNGGRNRIVLHQSSD